MSSKPRAAASAMAKNIPPQATSTFTLPSPGTSTGVLSSIAKAGTFSKVIERALTSITSARTRMSPAGASRTSSVIGSVTFTRPLSISTVAVQIVFDPLMAGYSACSRITKPASARRSVTGRTTLAHIAG